MFANLIAEAQESLVKASGISTAHGPSKTASTLVSAAGQTEKTTNKLKKIHSQSNLLNS